MRDAEDNNRATRRGKSDSDEAMKAETRRKLSSSADSRKNKKNAKRRNRKTTETWNRKTHKKQIDPRR